MGGQSCMVVCALQSVTQVSLLVTLGGTMEQGVNVRRSWPLPLTRRVTGLASHYSFRALTFPEGSTAIERGELRFPPGLQHSIGSDCNYYPLTLP